MKSAFLKKIEKLSFEDLGFVEMGIISVKDSPDESIESDATKREIFSLLIENVLKKHDWAKSIIVLIRPYVPYKGEFPYGLGVYPAHYKQYPIGRRASQKVAALIESEGFRAESDSGIPVKPAALFAGLGLYGKNSLIYSKDYGSWITIHSVVTDAPYDSTMINVSSISDCGDCTLCINACPTDAIADKGKLKDARCLREYMIPRGVVPEEIRKLMGSLVLGCDICQIVCPKNKHRYEKAILPVDDEVKAFDIEKILECNDDFDSILDFITNVVGANYAKKEPILSAASIMAGNLKDRKYLQGLERLLSHPNDSVRTHAQWAISEINVS